VLRLLPRLFSNELYIQIRETELAVTELGTGKVWCDEPLLAIKREAGMTRILEVGSKAKRRQGPAVELINPFSHPRTLLKDFIAAEKLLQVAFRQLHQSSVFRPSPFVIIHPLEKTDGGLTEVEERAFRELALGAGARGAIVWQGKALTNVEARERISGFKPKQGDSTATPLSQWLVILTAASAIVVALLRFEPWLHR
jgi:rod shape-determining protein MreB